MSRYNAVRADEQKRIIVNPGETFSAGCKPGHGWLRVIDTAMNARIYKLPIADGQLDKSVAAVLATITHETSAGTQSKFYWRREKGGIFWVNEGEFDRNAAALDDEFFSRRYDEFL